MQSSSHCPAISVFFPSYSRHLLHHQAFLHLQLGTETEGSLMAPAERVGATGMRPSFGVIGRSGVMTLVDTLVCFTIPGIHKALQ